MIFLDFDGTLVDLWPRFYSVFIEILNLSEVTFEQYKEVKKKLKKDSEIARLFGRELPNDYFCQKAHKLEEDRYLNLDKLLFDKDEINDLLRHEAMILTKRRNSEAFYRELNRLGINDAAIVIKNLTKKEWIRNHVSPHVKVLIVGDSVTELEAAQLDNVESWLVGYGLLPKDAFDATGIPYQYFEKPYQLMNNLKGRIQDTCSLEI